MKRYNTLKSIYDFLQDMQISYEDVKRMEKLGHEPKREYVLFEKENVGHISVMMADRGVYELVSYNNRTDVYRRVNGHTEEFIDRIMEGQTGVLG